MRGAPPNPQAKMMTYMMPAMFLFFFINVASGLNLYYLIAEPRRRSRSSGCSRASGRRRRTAPVVQGTPIPTKKGSPLRK